MPNSSEINRKEFLNIFGLGAVAVLATACLGGCGSKGGDPIPGASNVDFTLDLTAPGSAAFNDPATGFVYSPDRSVIVAKTTTGTYVAVQAPCTHQGTSVYFSPGQNRFVCPNHNAIFDLGGGVISGPAPSGLKHYAVAQTGNNLRITG